MVDNWDLTNIKIQNYVQNWILREYIGNIEEYTQNQNKTITTLEIEKKICTLLCIEQRFYEKLVKLMLMFYGSCDFQRNNL